MMNHFAEQVEAKRKLSQMKVGAFFMEAGTGKTRPLVEIIRDISPSYVVYFAPYRCINADDYKESTQYEIEKWGGFECDYDLVGVESISSSDRLYLNLFKRLKSESRPVLIVDESLKIKNEGAIRTKRIKELGKIVEFKFILNGTPISRNLLDLKSQMDFLSPSILNMDMEEFKDSFCEYKQMKVIKPCSSRPRTKEWIVKYHNMDYLYEMIEPYIYNANLNINIGLDFIDIEYKLSDDEREEHKKIMEEVLSEDWLRAKPNFFLMLTQRLQNNYSRNEEKFQIVHEVLKSNPKTLIVAKFIETQEALKKRFPEARVLSWQKNSFGLNLQYEYNEMLLFDQHWDYGLFDQIIKRIYRQNQLKNCVVRRLIGDCGLEKMMYDNVDKKADFLQEFKRLTLEQFKRRAK